MGLSWNEESRRYIDEEPEFWFPKEWRARPDGSVKQGSGDVFKGYVYHEYIHAGKYPDEYVTGVDESPERVLESSCEFALRDYQAMLYAGVAPEMARMILPLNTHTNWIWSGSLAAWARVCNLRLDPHAQREVQEVAKMINDHCQHLWPVSWASLVDKQNS